MDKRRQELVAITRMIGGQIAKEMNDANTGPPIGFMLMMFDFGPDGFSSYISNARRADMVKALREQADRLEAGTDDTKGEA
jgi:hypothetical protein